jgi:hypothetical protein
MALVLVCPAVLRGVLCIGGAAVGISVAAQVQALGWHQIVDAMGGGLVAFAVAAAVTGGLVLIGGPQTQAGGHHWPSILFLTAVVVTAAGAAVGISAQGLGLHSPTPSPAEWSNAYRVAVAATIALIAIVFAALLFLVRDHPVDPPLWTFRWRAQKESSSTVDSDASLSVGQSN